DLAERPVRLTRLPVGLGLGQSLDLAQHVGAHGLEVVPERRDRSGKRHGDSASIPSFTTAGHCGMLPTVTAPRDREPAPRPPAEADAEAARRRALARASWHTRTTRRVYENPWMRIREDTAQMPDGRTTIYGVVECRPAVGVLPFLDEDTVVLVGQYR